MADTYPKASDAALKRFDALAERTGCEVVPADEVDMKRLMKMYFESAPPFEDSAKKKNEFPDAIALITLEAWAEENKKKILAISKDVGWACFARNSAWIDVEADLAAGLQKLQPDADKARELVATLLGKMDSNEAPNLYGEVEKGVKYGVEDLMPMAEGSSGYHMDADVAELSFSAMTFIRDYDGEFDFKIVHAEKERIVARVAVQIEANASASFSMQIRDEGEYIPVASGSGREDIQFEAGALITFGGDFTKKPPDVVVDEVEFVDGIKSVDFGEIRIDWDPDDRYETDS